jgi:hypothetical protein
MHGSGLSCDSARFFAIKEMKVANDGTLRQYEAIKETGKI